VSGTRPHLDLSLGLVLDTSLCPPGTLTRTAADAVEAGASVVELRDDDASDAEFVALGRLLRSVLASRSVPLIVGDRIHLVDAIGAQGVRLSRAQPAVAEARGAIGPTAYLGVSVEREEDVDAAVSFGADVADYLTVGPMWSSGSEPDTPVPVDRLRAVIACSPWPVVAMDVSVDSVEAVKGAQAAGVVAVHAICGQDDVSAATRALRQEWDAPR
jgi:thiamine-phosphate pyrophosphorylase